MMSNESSVHGATAAAVIVSVACLDPPFRTAMKSTEDFGSGWKARPKSKRKSLGIRVESDDVCTAVRRRSHSFFRSSLMSTASGSNEEDLPDITTSLHLLGRIVFSFVDLKYDTIVNTIQQPTNSIIMKLSIAFLALLVAPVAAFAPAHPFSLATRAPALWMGYLDELNGGDVIHGDEEQEEDDSREATKLDKKAVDRGGVGDWSSFVDFK